jgi:hypothetical protein
MNQEARSAVRVDASRRSSPLDLIGAVETTYESLRVQDAP